MKIRLWMGICLSFALGALVLTGCAKRIVWTHPSSSANFAADRYACTQESRTSWQAVNPLAKGGAVQGLAAGLLEELVYDEGGQLLTGTFMDYCIPKADDVPWLPVALTEHRSVINPLGVKGVGESGAIPGAAAIANAVEDAVADLGVTIREVPVTPARLHALLEQARAGVR